MLLSTTQANAVVMKVKLRVQPTPETWVKVRVLPSTIKEDAVVPKLKLRLRLRLLLRISQLTNPAPPTVPTSAPMQWVTQSISNLLSSRTIPGRE
jgi:hypothetical protein